MSGAGLKKCIPTTRSGVDVAAAISVTDSADVFVARIASGRVMRLELGEQLELGLEILDDRLDHEVAVGEVGEVGRDAQPPERDVPLLCRHLLLVDLALEEVRDPVPRARRAELVRDLPADGLVARLDRQLRDAGTHGSEADDADRLDLEERPRRAILAARRPCGQRAAQPCSGGGDRRRRRASRRRRGTRASPTTSTNAMTTSANMGTVSPRIVRSAPVEVSA